MFIKLLKHDFRGSWKVFFAMFAGLAAAIAILALTMTVPTFEPSRFDTMSMDELTLLFGVEGTASWREWDEWSAHFSERRGLQQEFFTANNVQRTTIAVLVALVALASYLLVIRIYNRSFFKAEGHLLLTMPASRLKLVASKVVMTMVWFNFLLILVPFAVYAAVAPTGLNPPWPMTAWELFTSLLFSWPMFTMLVYVNVAALVVTSLLFLTITATNSVVFGKKVNVIVAGVLAAFVHFLAAWGVVGLYTRFWVPLNQWGSMQIPLVGLRYGRIVPGSWQPELGGIVFIDIWLIGAGLALAAGAIALTVFLLKKRVSLR